MITSKNCGAFILVGLCAWRVMACSSSKGPSEGGQGGTGGYYFGAGGGASSAGRPGTAGSFGAAPSQGQGGSDFIFIPQGGTTNMRGMDSSCHPLAEIPEQMIVTDSTVITDTITTLTPV